MRPAPASAPLDHAAHSRFSDPATHAALLDAVDATPEAVSRVARNVLVHYRASDADLPPENVGEIHLRWMSAILDRDQSRHPVPLDQPREEVSRVQGCCRDFTLLSVAALRQHGIPARSRIGFAGYFVDGWHHDHVVPEMWDGERWLRFEPEVAEGRPSIPDPLDLETGEGAGFETAAEVWRAYRSGRTDLGRYGVDASVPGLRGPWFVRGYVVQEVAHRFGDEMLLWDDWGNGGGPGSEARDVELVDEVSALLVAADAGEPAAEQTLLDRYRADERLHPGPRVLRRSPLGETEVWVDLTAQTSGSPGW